MDDTNTQKKKFSRDQIREAVASSQSTEEIVTAFGVEIAVRPPNIGGLMAYRDWQNDDSMIARAIVNNCYVPGTTEKVFEEADVEMLMGLEYGPDMKKLNNAIQKALGDDSEVQEAIDNDMKSNPK